MVSVQGALPTPGSGGNDDLKVNQQQNQDSAPNSVFFSEYDKDKNSSVSTQEQHLGFQEHARYIVNRFNELKISLTDFLSKFSFAEEKTDGTEKSAIDTDIKIDIKISDARVAAMDEIINATKAGNEQENS